MPEAFGGVRGRLRAPLAVAVVLATGDAHLSGEAFGVITATEQIGRLRHVVLPLLEAQLRRAELAAARRLDPRIRATARRLVDELLAGWEDWRASRGPGSP